MRTNIMKSGAFTVATLLGLAACSQSGPVSSNGPAGNAVKPPVQADRQLLSTDSTPNLDTFQEYAQELPESISMADASRLLVKVDPSQVKENKQGYSLQWFRGLGLGFGWPYRYAGLGINSLLYYPYRSYLYPYSLINNVYYPYTYATYSPFLYGGLYSGLYPFYGGLGLFGSSFFGRGFGRSFRSNYWR